MMFNLAKYTRLYTIFKRPGLVVKLPPAQQYLKQNFSAFAATRQLQPLDIKALLSKPTWSVRSLLPTSEATSTEVTPDKLHHLLRLSALPLPKTLEEEAEMLKTLHSQLHFVKEIQKVDTEGIEPLVAIRDETDEAQNENTIGLDSLKDALANEETKGRNRRPRRKRDMIVDTKGVEDWDVLGTAERTAGKYFIVDSSKE